MQSALRATPALWQPDLNLTGNSASAGCRMLLDNALPWLPHSRIHVQHERLHSAAVQTAQSRCAGCACPKCWRRWSSAATAQPRWRARSPPAQVKYCSRMSLGSQQTLPHSSKPHALLADLVLRWNLQQSDALLCCSLWLCRCVVLAIGPPALLTYSSLR